MVNPAINTFICRQIIGRNRRVAPYDEIEIVSSSQNTQKKKRKKRPSVLIKEWLNQPNVSSWRGDDTRIIISCNDIECKTADACVVHISGVDVIVRIDDFKRVSDNMPNEIYYGVFGAVREVVAYISADDLKDNIPGFVKHVARNLIDDTKICGISICSVNVQGVSLKSY